MRGASGIRTAADGFKERLSAKNLANGSSADDDGRMVAEAALDVVVTGGGGGS